MYRLHSMSVFYSNTSMWYPFSMHFFLCVRRTEIKETSPKTHKEKKNIQIIQQNMFYWIGQVKYVTVLLVSSLAMHACFGLLNDGHAMCEKHMFCLDFLEYESHIKLYISMINGKWSMRKYLRLAHILSKHENYFLSGISNSMRIL